MLRSRILVACAASLALGAAACATDAAGDPQLAYVDAVRAVLSDAAEVDDALLVRLGRRTCEAIDLVAAEQETLELLYREARRFGVDEYRLARAAIAAADPLCRALDEAWAVNAVAAVDGSPPPRAELVATVTGFRDVLFASLEEAVATLAVDGEPAALGLTAVSLRDGVLTVEVAAVPGQAAPELIAYEITRALAPIEHELLDHGPLTAALVRGAPTLTLVVVVDAADSRTFRVDATLLAELASGGIGYDEWGGRVTVEAP